MSRAYIINGVRSAVGSLGGSLSTVRTDDLAAAVLKSLLDKNPGFNPALIDDVILGCANQAGEDNRNIARMALLLAGLPFTVPGETVNRLCASGLAAAINASRAIANNDIQLAIAGGVEHMTRGPWVISKASQPFGRDSEMFDSSFGWRFVNPEMKRLYGTDSMGETAENLASLFNVSREDQDRFALWSQQKAAIAQDSGRLAKEICPVLIPKKKGEPEVFQRDEFVKPDTSLEGLAKLRPAFKKEGGSVTAGNSSGLNDGAAAILLASEQVLTSHNFNPLACIRSSAVVGVEPRIMGIGPVEASRRALAKAGLSLDDMDVIEINEAFAAQVLACTRQLGLEDTDPRINPNGGGIALGHPLGMTGARLLLTASLELQERNKRYALVTMCIGVGQGYACIIERV